jgi:hypothetical protein
MRGKTWQQRGPQPLAEQTWPAAGRIRVVVVTVRFARKSGLFHRLSAGTMMGVLTGHAIERFTLTMFKSESTSQVEREAKLKELREKLVKAFDQKKLVTTGTNRTVSPKPPSINGNHAYAIIGYDAKTDHIKIWNPHGQNFTPKGKPSLQNGYETNGGKFEMPLEDFVKVFAGLAFEVLDMK